MKTVTVSTDQRNIKGSIHLPTSKSISNRALIIKALSRKKFSIHNLSEADDTRLMNELLNKIQNHKGINDPLRLDCRNAGTVFRFLTAFLANTPGNYILTGAARMKERPIKILVDALIQLGANISYLKKEGLPPIQIKGIPLSGGALKIPGNISSQYISALLMVAPTLKVGLTLDITSELNSRPFVDMTIGLMEYFGIEVSRVGQLIHIEEQKYEANTLTVEADWSSASFWYEIVALSSAGELILEGLQKDSLQGDAVLPEIYNQLGVTTRYLKNRIIIAKAGFPVSDFHYNFKDHPDLALPVIITCAALGIRGRFRGLESLRIKESDRIVALYSELRMLGFEVALSKDNEFRTSDDQPSINRETIKIKTYADHRIAMSFTPLALMLPQIEIESPEVVSKSYPAFWKDISHVGFRCNF